MIVGQMGSTDHLIEQMKILERIESAKLDKGLGKNRKKGHSSGGKSLPNSAKPKHKKEKRVKKEKYSVVPGQKSSCRPRDHKDASKLLLDKTLDLIVPQIWTPGMPSIRVAPDEATSAKIESLTTLLQSFRDEGVDFNINLGFMDTIKGMLNSVNESVSIEKIGAFALMALLVYVGRKAYLSHPDGKFLLRGWNCENESYATEVVDTGVQHATAWSCLFAVLSAAVTMFYSKQLGDFLVSVKDYFLTPKDEIVAQSGKETIRDSLLAALYGLIAVGSMTKKTVSDKILSAFKAMGDLPKINSGLDFTVEWLSDIAQRFVNFVAAFFKKEPWILSDHPHPEAMAYIVEVEELVRNFNENEYEITSDYGNRVFELELKGNRIAGAIDTRTAASQRAFRTTNVAIRSLKPIIERLRRSNIVGNGPRIPPVGVLIGGATNIGKSHVIQFLMKQCGAHMVSRDKRASYVANVNNHIYNVVSENRFWDNYTGQTVVCVDDLFQATDVAGNPANEAFNVVRMINQNNFPLTMAHLEDKGNVNFTSKLVVATTNVSSCQHLKSVHAPEAVARRFKLAYVAKPKDEYGYVHHGKPSTNPFNWSMRGDAWPEDPADFSRLEFIPWDYGLGVAKRDAGGPISFEELQSKIIAEYKSTRTFGEKTLRSHQEKLQQEIDMLNAEDEIEAQVFGADETHLEFSPEMLRSMPNSFMTCSGPTDPLFPSVVLSHVRQIGFNGNEDLFLEFIALPPIRRQFTMNRSFRHTMGVIWGVWKDFSECVPQIGRDHVDDDDESTYSDAEEIFEAQLGPDREHLLIKDPMWLTLPGASSLKEGGVKYSDDPILFNCLYAHFGVTLIRQQIAPEVLSAALQEPEVAQIMAKEASWCVAELDLLDHIQQFRYRNNNLAISELLKKYIDDMTPYMSPVWELLKAFKWAIMAFTVSRLVSTFVRNHFEKEVDGQSETGVRQSTTNVRATRYKSDSQSYKSMRLSRQKGAPIMEPVGQAGVEDRGCVDMINVILERNSYLMKVKGLTGYMGVVTFVKDTHAVAPLHFGGYLQSRLQTNDEVDSVELWKEGASVPTFTVPVDEMYSTVGGNAERADFTVLTFPENHVKRHKDIIDKFMENSASLQDAKFPVYLPLYRKKWFIHSSWARAKGSINYRVGGDPEPYHADETFEYDIPTNHGDCGNLLYVRDTKNMSKILGFHVAGHGHRGISTVIERQWIIDAIAIQVESSGMESIEDVDFPETVPQTPISEEIKAQGFVPLLRVDKPLRSPVVSNIVPSRLHGAFTPSLMRPVYLRPFKLEDGTICDPMHKARSKYAASPTPVSSRLVAGITEVIYSKLVNDSIFDAAWDKPRIFTFEEACGGVQDVLFFDGLPRGTSAGYPLSLEVPPGFKGKQHIFGKEGPYDFTSTFAQKLREDVARCESDARSSKRNLHVYSDFLKDERKETEKVDLGKARMVSGAPLAHTVLMRMYFGDFVRHIMANRVKNGIAVGMNTFKEWDDLANLLRKRSRSGLPNCMAGDYRGYDGSLIVLFLRIFLVLANRWYADEHSKVREVLFQDITNSRHIYADIIYEWFGSNPSGCFLTACLNSVVNLAAIYIASLVCMLGEEAFTKMNWATFDWHVYGPKLLHDVTPVTFGDDNIIAVTDNVRHLIDQNKFTRALSLIGFEYTPEDKTDGELAKPLRPVEDITFLKRSFAKTSLDGRYTCPLQFDVILEMTQWTKKGDLGAIEITNVNTALEEMSLHPRAVFNKWSPKLLKAAQEILEYVPICTDYESLQARKLASEGYVGSA